MRCRFCSPFDRTPWDGVRGARGEEPFQVRRGRMVRGTSVTFFGGAMIAVYQSDGASAAFGKCRQSRGIPDVG